MPLRAVHTIVFDLDGVLLDADWYPCAIKLDWRRLNIFWNLGPLNLMRYAFAGKNPFYLEKSLFGLLTAVDQTAKNRSGLTSSGRIVPGIMYEWLIGKRSGAQIRKAVSLYMDSNTSFLPIERLLLSSLVDQIFDPRRFVSYCTLSHAGLAFVKRCKQFGYRVCILSDWDKESFELLRLKFPELFGLFADDDLFISGYMHLAKPSPEIFARFCALVPEPVVFLDDQAENVRVASQFPTIQAIQFTGLCSPAMRNLSRVLFSSAI